MIKMTGDKPARIRVDVTEGDITYHRTLVSRNLHSAAATAAVNLAQAQRKAEQLARFGKDATEAGYWSQELAEARATLGDLTALLHRAGQAENAIRRHLMRL